MTDLANMTRNDLRCERSYWATKLRKLRAEHAALLQREQTLHRLVRQAEEKLEAVISALARPTE